ncbi:MAG: cytochrome c-type biogenesis protein CcmH [Paracoccus sp. (in: a-proteobacteria)]
MIRLLALLLFLSAPASAQMVAEAPGETRIRDLAQTLRCPVCQSESILESRSSTAHEMMVILREMAEAGRSDAEITEFFRSRYGDFVVLAPPARGAGRIIWALPLVLAFAGAGLVILAIRRARPRRDVPEGPVALNAERLRETEL